MVVKVASELGYTHLVVLAVLGVELHVAVVVQEDGLRVVLGDQLELDALAVEAALELHRVLCQVEALDARLVHARGEYELTVG